MTDREALRIIRHLRDEVWPFQSDDTIAEGESIYRHPDIQKALAIAEHALYVVMAIERKRQQRWSDSCRKPSLSPIVGPGARWTTSEDMRLRAEFKQGLTTAEIAKRHNRSVGAIYSRLLKHGLVLPPNGLPPYE